MPCRSARLTHALQSRVLARDKLNALMPSEECGNDDEQEGEV
jgi:hypothetical protein